MDLVAATPEQLDKYKDGSHRGKKKLEEVEKAEAARILAEARRKARKKAKGQDGGSTSREVDVGDMVKRREVQVEVQKAGKAEARQREELLEEERVAAEKKIQAEEQQKIREQKKKRVREEWQINVRLAEEKKKKQDKTQFDMSLAKALVLEGDRCETVVLKKAVWKDLTSEELDQEFRELNAAQIWVNTRLAVEQIVELKGDVRKGTEKM